MTIEQLNEIVKQMDLAKIQTALEQNGYRHASKNGKWEFSPIDIAKAGEVQNSERHEDTFDDKVYIGDLHTQVKGQGDYEFIVITVYRINRHDSSLGVLKSCDYQQPIALELYTNAPINEEYEREQNRIAKCEVCKREFTMSELTKVNGKIVCHACFEEDLNRLTTKGKSKLAKKVKGGK